MFNSCSSPQHIHQQQQNSLPMANGLGGIGFDLLNKQSQAVTAVTTAQFVASQRPPQSPLNANVKQFTFSSNAISSSPPPPASVGSAPIGSAVFDGQKMTCRRSSPSSSAAFRRGMSPSKCRAKSSSPSPSRQQQKHRNGSLMGRQSSGGGGGVHRRRAVHQHGGRNGTGGGSSEQSAGGAAVPASTTTIRYNYAQRKDSAEKTPMCRLAELARANHLKHEYVLLDESGPAHCKQFVVKLVLRPGLEFDGSGPSIKKAQQSAAQAALDRWCQLPLRQPPPVPTASAPPLPLPPFATAVPSSVMSQQQHQQQQYHLQKRHLWGGAISGSAAAVRHNSTRRDDTKNPVCLLNNVAAQLGINLHYREESFSPFNDNFSKSLQHPSFLTYLLPQALCPAAAIQSVNGSLAAPLFANLPHQQRQQQQQNTSGTFQPPPFGSPPPHASAILPTSQMNTAQNGAAGLLSNALMLPPPPPSAFHHSLALANPLSASLFNPSLGQLQYHHHYHHHHHVLSVSPANGRHHINPFPLAQPNRQKHAYKVTVRLSKDGTEHTALGPTLTTAKQKAATLALAHLRPELEQLKLLLKEAEGTEEEKQIVPKLVTKIDGTDQQQQQRQHLLGCDAASKFHHLSSSSPTDEMDQQQQYDGLNDDDDDEAVAAELVEPVPLEEAESCREERRQSANKNADLDGDDHVGDQQQKINAKFAVSTVDHIKQGEQQKLNQRPHKKYKSVVSQIHECALQLRMNVEFEMVAEFGEPHNRTYTVSVRLFSPPSLESHHQQHHQHDFINGMMEEQRQGQREFMADGQGLSKKAAKQAACQKLLGQVKHQLELDPIQLASSIVRPLNGAGALRRAANLLASGGEAASSATAQQQQQQKQETTTSSSSTKRKTIIKDKKIDPNYGTGVNPISRLIQVMQARGERDPMFQVVGEHGQNRHKEFTVSVQCMGEQEQGNGPNKKLAKRAAAEAMLAKIGYVKPMPQPGKSLLKKSSIITTINNTENNYSTSADFALPSTPEKMPIIDMFVVPPEEPDITENDNDNASQQNNKQFINQCQTTFMEQQWHQQDEEEEEEQDGGIITGAGGGWHHKATEELARVTPKQRQAVPKGLETFADVEQQCFSSTTIDEQQQQFVQHHLQQQQRCIHEAAQQGNSDNIDKVVLNNDNYDSDYQRLNWVNPPSLEMEEEQEADFLHGHGHVTQQLHHRHRSADDDDHCASSPSELGSGGSHSPDNDGTPSRASGDALHHHHHHRRRRVTFSDTVRACPPPGASESADSVAPLKSELCTKPRRRLRPSSKDSQRVLSEDETKRLACATALFLAWPTVEAEKCGLTLLKVNGTNPTTTPTTTSMVQTDHGANQVAAADQVLVDDDELLGAALQTLDNVGANKALLLDENGGGTIAPSLAVPTTLLNNSAIVSLALAPVCNSNRLPTGLNMTTFPSSTPTTMLNSIPVVSNFNSVPIQSLASLNTNLAPPHANAIRMMLPSAAVMGNNNNMMAQSAHSLNNNGLNSMNCLNRMFAAIHLNVPPPSVAPPFNNSCLNLTASSSPPQITMPPPSIFSVPPPPVPQLQPIISAASPTVVVMPSSPKPPPQFSIQHNTQCQKFKLMEAKQFLEMLASVYKFTVVYSDFPKTRNDANEEQCFSLVTLGFAKPIVCHGSGPTKQVAHNDAALNAIRKCNNN